MKAEIDNIRHTFRMMAWTWSFIRTWRARFIVCAAFSVTQNAWMTITTAYLIGQTTVHAASGDFKSMLGTVGIVAVIAVMGIIIITLVSYHISKINILGLAQLRKTLFAKLNAIPVSDAENQLSGDLSTRLSMDTENAASFFSSMMTGDRSLIAIPVSVILSVIICIVKLPVVGIPTFIFLIASIYTNLACIRREYSAQSRRMGVVSVLTQHMADIISGRIVARIFGLISQRQSLYEKDSETAYSHAMNGAKYNAMRSSLSSAIQWGSIIFTMIIGGFFVHRGITDIGAVVFIVLLQSQINNDVLLIANSYQRLQYATVAAARVREIYDHPDERMRDNTVEPNYSAKAAIDIQHATISYEKNKPVVKDLSLTVKNGEKLAIVGGSGGGKTTLIKYIMEFVEADRGTIQYFGQPRKRYSQKNIRALAAYVPQNFYLFDGTIRENIAWGNPQATDDMIRNAAHDAGLKDLIDSLPDGIDTRVGEQGAQLSGGQRQRIAIARAIVRDAPLLLLDEATSALDGESEQAVQQALKRLMRGRTSIVIAHRLSTIQNADRVIVIENGKIVEEGCPGDLLANAGRYAELFQLQFA